MSESQYAVFHFDVKTMTMLETTPVVFGSFAEAEKHCQAEIGRDPARGCRIYDHSGKIVQTFSDEGTYNQHHGRPAAKRTLMIGVICLIAGACSVGLDAWLEWRLTLGVILGARLIWVGGVKFAEGVSGLSEYQ